jgi:UDP-N-acetylmuramate-alanine ligase
MPVYKADDAESADITSDDLYKNLLANDKDALFVNDKPSLQNVLKEIILQNEITKEDLIIFAGAGSISKWAREIVSEMIV